MSDTDQIDVEMREMLAGVEERVNEQGARSQAAAAFAMLMLMGELDFSRLNPELKQRYLSEVFKFVSYAIAGMPVVQNAIQATNPGFQKTNSIAGVVRQLAPLFGADAEPLIAQMLGLDGVHQ